MKQRILGGSFYWICGVAALSHAIAVSGAKRALWSLLLLICVAGATADAFVVCFGIHMSDIYSMAMPF